MTGAELARAFADFVNGSSKKEVSAFVEELTSRTHRTLQQGSMGVMLRCIEAWAEAWAQNRFDLRNEATVKLAQRIVAATGDQYDRTLPLI